MSKILAATCVAGIVKVGALPVLGTEILSQGVGASSGILILQGDDGKYYITNTADDLKSALDSVSAALGSAASALTAINAATIITTCGAGPGTGAPILVAAADIAALTAAKAQIDLLRVTLK